jgi:hypothetical protein
MLVSEARVHTDRPGRYLEHLCRHFARKVRAGWDGDTGHADFGWGTCVLVAGDGFLDLRAEAADAEGLGRVEHVVADHAERFGARDGLRVTWQRSDIDHTTNPVSLG